MKKFLVVFLTFAAIVSSSAQTLEEIVKKQSQALKESQYDNIKSLKITGKISQMGMDLTMNMYYKAPNLSKNVISFNGQEIVQVFDGEKAYMINPMTGSSDPQELPASQSENLRNNSSFKSPLGKYLKDGKLTLEGSEDVKGKAAFKIKAVDGENTYYMFVDKATYMLTKMNIVSSGMSIDTFMEWGDVNGLMLPKKTTTSASGMEILMIIDSAEINPSLEDSFFKVK
ncbi:MAG: hypothetical protein U0X39_02690 [Bacteroidales bacterium]